MTRLFRLASFLILAGCATQFTGDPKIPSGVSGCRSTCARDGLEFGGFVYSGEFATSCVCVPPRAAGGPSATGEVTPATGVAIQTDAAATAAAVAAQMQRQQQHQSSQSHRF